MANSTGAKAILALFKAELQKDWNTPILEFAVILMTLISISAIPTLVKISVQNDAYSTFRLMVINGVSDIVTSQMLPLIMLCAILMALSFARDYEQGLMQSLLSSPISRTSLFILKFLAVILPLTALSWGFLIFFLILSYYSNVSLVLEFSIIALPIIFLALMFYGGIATLASLVIKRAIPSVLTAMSAAFFFWFITTLKTEIIGSIAEYLALTPYKAPLVLLNRIIGLSYPVGTLENGLPLWTFAALTLFYACIFVFPTYVYFIRGFEVRD
ncbi:MAG: ABC transporter permease subunit [Candidatus Bathyarchaeia archaeon]